MSDKFASPVAEGRSDFSSSTDGRADESGNEVKDGKVVRRLRSSGECEDDEVQSCEEEDDLQSSEDNRPLLQPIVESQVEALATRVSQYLQQFETRILGQLESLRRRCEDVVEDAVQQLEARLKAVEEDQPRQRKRLRKLGQSLEERLASRAEEDTCQRRRVEVIEARQQEWWLALEEGLHALLAELEGTVSGVRSGLCSGPLKQGICEQAKEWSALLRGAELPTLVATEIPEDDAKTQDQRSAEIFAKLLQLHRDALDSRARLADHAVQLETIRERMGMGQDDAAPGHDQTEVKLEQGQLEAPPSTKRESMLNTDCNASSPDTELGITSRRQQERSNSAEHQRISESEDSLSDASGSDQTDALSED